MAKVTLNSVGSTSFSSATNYNANMAAIAAAMENTLSRDGTSPNAMGADLDMNSNSIINLDGLAVTGTITATSLTISANTTIGGNLTLTGTLNNNDVDDLFILVPIANDIVTVAGLNTEIGTVSGINQQIIDVAGIENDIAYLAANLDEIADINAGLSSANAVQLEAYEPAITRVNLTGDSAITTFTPTSVVNDGNGRAQIVATAHGVNPDTETSVNLTSVANNGSGAPRFTATSHGLSTDHIVILSGTSNYDRAYRVTAIDANTFDLQNETYTAETLTGATVTRYHVQFIEISGTTNYNGIYSAVPSGVNTLLLVDTPYTAETFSGASANWLQYYHVPGLCRTNTPGELFAVVLTNPNNSGESRPGQRVVVNRSTDYGLTWSGWNEELTSSTYTNNPLTFDGSTKQQGEPHIAYFSHLNQIWLVFINQDPDNGSILAKLDLNIENPKWDVTRLEFSQTTYEARYSTKISGSPNSGYSLTQTIDDAGNHRPVLYRPIYDSAGNIVFAGIWLRSFGTEQLPFAFWTSDNGTTWEWANVPVGDLGSGGAWESCILQTQDKRYRMQVRKLGGSENFNQVVSESATLRDWAPAEDIKANWHTDKMVFQAVRPNLYFGMGTVHAQNRNATSLLLSRDGVEFTAAFQLDNVIDGVSFAHYPAFDTDNTYFYGLITTGNASPVTVHSVQFVRFALPTGNKFPVSGNAKNSVEDNVTTKTSFKSGNNIEVPPGANMQLPAMGLKTVYALKIKTSDTPTTNAAQLMQIGRGPDIARVELRSSGSIYAVDQYNNETLIKTLVNPERGFDLSVYVDLVKRIARIEGVDISIPSHSVVGIGDMTNVLTDTDVTIYLQADKSYISPRTEFGGVISGDAITVSDLYVNGNTRHRGGDFLLYDGILAVDRRGDSTDGVVRIYRDSGKAGWFQVYKAGVGEWFIGIDGDSNFKVRRRNGATGAYIDDPIEVDTATGNVTLRNTISITDFLNLGTGNNVSVASGAITVTNFYMRVDTESAASSSDLATINGGTEGNFLLLKSVNSSRNVVLKHATGNIFCGTDRTLNSVSDFALLYKVGSQWHLVSFADN